MHIAPHARREAHSRIPGQEAGARRFTRSSGNHCQQYDLFDKGDALVTAASQQPFSASKPWNHVATFSLHGLIFINVSSTTERWDNMIKGSDPIQMTKNGLGEELWYE